jgi:hypothetical protein
MWQMTKATLYLDDRIHKALKLKAADTGATVSELANQALSAALAEDLEDLESLKERAGGRTERFEEFLTQLKADGAI